MEKLKLTGRARDDKTSRSQLKNSGEIPAVLYGHNVKSQNLAVKVIDFEKAFKAAGESTVVDLETGEGKTHPVIIQDVQYDNVSSRPMHVDFYEVSMTEKLKAHVQLEFSGESKAVKELGGVLVKILNEVEVECLPADLPHNLTVDISVLADFSRAITVKNIAVPAKVKVLTPGEEVVAKVQPPRNVEEELKEEKPVEDVSAVEGAAEDKPEAAEGGEAEKGAEKAQKEENK